jgi:hypothetical protein
VSAGIVAVGIAVPDILDGRTGRQAARLSRVSGFETSTGVAVWWSTTLFLLVAVLAYGEAVRVRPLEATTGRRWALLALVFAWASFDHAVHVHEAVSKVAGHVGAPRWLDPATLALAVAFAVAAIPLLLNASTSYRLRFGAALLLLGTGAWGVDAVVGAAGRGSDVTSQALEAACEWAGLLWMALLVAHGGSRHGKVAGLGAPAVHS